MDKLCRTMNLSELRAYSIKYQLSPIGTGRNGLVTKKDLFKVCKKQEELLQSEQFKESVKALEHQMKYFNSLQGKITKYELSIASLFKELQDISQTFIETKNRGEFISPTTLEFILIECLYFQKRGIRDFDHIIPILANMLNDFLL